MDWSETDESAAKEQGGLELFLLQLRYKEGTLRDAESNSPFLLDDPDSVWVVYSGQVDVFAVPIAAGEPAGGRRHLYRAEVGHALFGMAGDAERGFALLASGLPGTRILQLERERLRELGAEIEHGEIVCGLIDNWILGLSSGMARGLPPKDALPAEDDEQQSIKPGDSLVASKGVVWTELRAGRALFLGRESLPRTTGEVTPLCRYSWLRAAEQATVYSTRSEQFLAGDADWAGITAFNRLALAAIGENYARDEAAERQRLREKSAAQQVMIEGAMGQIAGLLEPRFARPLVAPAAAGDSLLAALRLVGRAQGVEIRPAPGANKEVSAAHVLKRIAAASYVRTRQVALRGEWWRRSGGPLLAFREESGAPVALLPAGEAGYVLVDPARPERVPVTGALAAQLAPFAHALYRPFPARPLKLIDLLRFGLRDVLGDLRAVMLLGMAMGLLGLATPLATGLLFDTIIPAAEIGLLWQVGLALLLLALATAMLRITQSIALLRMEGKMDGVIQAALWDRLLALPVPFFRDYSSGDLGMRAMGIQQIRQVLSGAVLTSITSSIFSVFSLALLFYYNAGLAVVAMGLVLLLVVVTSLAGYLQVRYERERAEIEGRISGTVLGIIGGITKFRVAGLESRAFALWADGFTRQRQLTYRAQDLGNRLEVFNAAYPILAALTIFALVAGAPQAGFSTGEFLAFNVAFGQVVLAGLQLSAASTSLLGIVPLYERARPILQAMPEVDQAKEDPGELAGEIEVSHLSFRYRENGPLVLKDVSLRIRPGEFVAFVGASGSGKSTMLRMLLGFEKQEAGGIYYDGQDLSGLDVRGVRQQIGVVLQHGKLLAGDIFGNITGGAPGLTIDDAWQAARMAGLEADIREMPMGMHTIIGEGASTLSGGQRQRILIARAVVNRPRIIFFDEATSALDNNTQDIVSKSLERLQATRVVIAHRLSTILNADRIFVFEDGRLAQSGTYAELVDQPGPFAELAKRQIG